MSSLIKTSDIISYSLPVAQIRIELLFLSELNLGRSLVKISSLVEMLSELLLAF